MIIGWLLGLLVVLCFVPAEWLPSREGKARVVGLPALTEQGPRGTWTLMRPLVIEVDGEQFTIPQGTTTDYSSVPQIFAWVVDFRRVATAGIVHDWIYQQGNMPRHHGDTIWSEVAMSGDYRANRVQGWLGYAGLRVGGLPTWRRYRRRDER